MAKIKLKFNLNFGGEEIRTLDDLRENFSIEDVLDNYNNGTLTRWLDSRNYNNELEQVRAIQDTTTQTGTDAREILAELIRIFSVGTDPSEINANISLIDYLEERRKFWEERKSLEPIEKELDEVKRERDALKQELEELKQNVSTGQPHANKTEQDNTAIRRAEIPVGTLNELWKVISLTGSYRIIGEGNCEHLYVKGSYNWPASGKYSTIAEAVKHKTVFDGISVLASSEHYASLFRLECVSKVRWRC